jgi:DNA repair exonuclease SbcCD ATPase subunit
MVVASCNNGAVENISKDLPLLEEVIRYGKEPTKENRKKDIEKTGIDPIIFHEYDLEYAKEAEKLDFFTKHAENLLKGERAWGMFSGAFGKGKNIQDISYCLQNKKNGNTTLLDYLKKPIDSNSWSNAVKEFNDLRQEIEADRSELKKFIKTMQKAEKIIKESSQLPSKINESKEHYDNLNHKTKDLEKQNEILKERLNNLPKPNFIVKMIKQILRVQNREENEIRKQRERVLKDLENQLAKKNQYKKKIKKLNKKREILNAQLEKITKLKEIYKDQQVTLSTNDFWKASFYKERQKAVLWQTNELNFKRGMLFLKALKVHKVFLHKNHRYMKSTIAMLQNLGTINLNIEENLKNIRHMWKTIHLIFPVMSTTFASLG